MKKYICSILCLMLGPAGLGSAQSPDAVPPQGTIEIQVRGIPSDDATAISGQYLLDGNGTIRMPQLSAGKGIQPVKRGQGHNHFIPHPMNIQDQPLGI